ncbi:retropepsin-like aspartic protease family protein [Mesorhizobium sp. ASY16-5R]|jgi:aspartyl protease family protein|uniref:retropepsin-like aspartic protease family protein n=1 Tax=Mesorhizobium sp. ASY16-5R TaxID=3445772 RepID=UPI003FA184BA
MLRNAILIGICIGASASVPLLYQANPDALEAFLGPSQPDQTLVAAVPQAEIKPATASASPSLSGRKVEIPADDRGHYISDFKINGRKVEAMIDTGATAVAINLSTARRLGLRIQSADMKGTVSTANGKARAAVVMIERLEIGRIMVPNVEALVLDDQSLSTTLIGMTFLNRLKKFEVGDGTLLLVQ